MSLDTSYLLYILIPFLVIVTGFLTHFILRYKKLKEDCSYYKEKKDNNKEVFDKYIKKIKFELQGRSQLRNGFIEQNLTSNKGNANEISFDALVEVKELKRTLNRSLIKVVSSKVIGKSNQSLFPIKEASDFYDGWIDSSKIEWMEIVDGREEIINDILKEIEEDETIMY